MIKEYLNWDSDFFKINIWKITSENILDINGISFDNGLTYFFSKDQISEFDPYLKDVKITYRKKIPTNTIHVYDQCIHSIFNKNIISDQLLNLTYQSGEYSRFNKDLNLPQRKFFELYKLWISNSVKGILSDEVLVYEVNEDIVGFITMKNINSVCKIGLIAVDTTKRGMGIGKKLMNAVDLWAFKNNCKEVVVETQEENLVACNFYEKLDFVINKKDYIYHIWK